MALTALLITLLAQAGTPEKLVDGSTVGTTTSGGPGVLTVSGLNADLTVACLAPDCLDREASRRVLKRYDRAARACFETLNLAELKVTLEFTVSPTGALAALKILAAKPAVDVNACLINAFKPIIFPPAKSPAKVTAQLTFTRFTANDGGLGSGLSVLGGMKGGDGMPVTPRRREDLHAEPKVSSDCATSNGGHCLPTPLVAKMVTAQKNQVLYCYERALMSGQAQPNDDAAIRFVISPEGTVTKAEATVDAGSPTISECLSARMRTWQFPRAEQSTQAFAHWEFRKTPGHD